MVRDGTKQPFRFNSVCLVKTYPNEIKNIVVATNKGSVQVYSLQDLRSPLQTIFGHIGECLQIQCSVDGKYMFTSGSDGIVLVYKVSEFFPAKQGRFSQIGLQEETGENQPKINDELAEIVLVNKSLMEDWRKQQEQLRLQMEEESNKVESSLRSEKYDFEKKIAKMEKLKTDELTELTRKYEQLQLSEAEQKDENTQQMKKMEITHAQYKEELQDLYERKLQYEQEQL